MQRVRAQVISHALCDVQPHVDRLQTRGQNLRAVEVEASRPASKPQVVEADSAGFVPPALAEEQVPPGQVNARFGRQTHYFFWLPIHPLEAEGVGFDTQTHPLMSACGKAWHR